MTTVTASGPGHSSLADYAYHALRDRLIMLDIPPGAPINEGQLALELEIGRTPIREGLKKLELDYLVVSYPRRGTFATRVDITDLANISELREVLEPLAARLAAQRVRTASGEALRRKAAQLAAVAAEPDNGRALLRYDLDVHRLIYATSENPHLEDTLVRLGNVATRVWALVLDRVPSVLDHVSEHAALLAAITDGDAERAAQLAFDHVRLFEQAIRDVL